jgi:peroxiredoxin Q/BCP
MGEVTIGQNAPELWLPTDEGDSIALTGLKGKTIILYFYPKNDTSGCTTQAQDFTKAADAFAAENAQVIGISKDKIASHQKFRAKYDLGITLASDFETDIAETFGVWVEKNMYGRKYMGMERSTFVINPDGIVTNIWRKVKVAGHCDEVLAVVQKMRTNG